ncbi:hypothetical protein TGMAS_356130 [Toxoplasma gondii MAS]|uniref:Uncharacterized protein n=2 Tax=Toxoplasma gondii TaxID=5811 RepID=A0A086QI06_TOXGO|nr:hypothetical protein TGMAS_356130 [Toxoplasma gondii MAS]PUA90023.1 hypothetical protein TGBR9_356130 [Toxoplasma gondii TgCATBr9]
MLTVRRVCHHSWFCRACLTCGGDSVFAQKATSVKTVAADCSRSRDCFCVLEMTCHSSFRLTASSFYFQSHLDTERYLQCSSRGSSDSVLLSSTTPPPSGHFRSRFFHRVKTR